MGRMMGAFDSDNDMIDRPELNKCPDCGCFFTQDACPLCGKICPEEMRAGNRQPPKKQKHKYSNGYRTVMFVDWYHRWWFIALAAFISPLIAVVLLITSPHKKAHKFLAIVIAVAYVILRMFIFPHLFTMINKPPSPVDTSLSKGEYIASCQEVDPERFYRNPGSFDDKFVSMTLVITGKFNSPDDYEYNTYYICKDQSGGEFEILVRSCLQDSDQNFIIGDTVTVYGEGDGIITAYDHNYDAYQSPCINAAYAELIKTMPT